MEPESAGEIDSTGNPKIRPKKNRPCGLSLQQQASNPYPFEIRLLLDPLERCRRYIESQWGCCRLVTRVVKPLGEQGRRLARLQWPCRMDNNLAGGCTLSVK